MRRRRHNHRRGKNKSVRNIVLSSFAVLFLLATGYSAFSTNITLTAKGNIKQDEECVVNKVWEYDYEDNKIYDFQVPCNGTYKLETWGAQGGNALTLNGGYGGYSVGTINLKRTNKLYIVVGGKGESMTSFDSNNSTNYYNPKGGYNGGGTGNAGYNKSWSCTYRYSTGGGGATHIALQTGLLTAFENDIYNLLIVSGGGGAFTANTANDGTGTTCIAYGNGSSAGGYIGNTATYTLATHSKIHYATGGTQSKGGTMGNSLTDDLSLIAKFGHGGEQITNDAGYNISGGGSGLYGGGLGRFAPGAGGSSYIKNDNLKDKHMTCYNCTPTTDTDPDGIKTISTDKVDEKPIEDTAKKGNGYAKITLISRN